MKRFECSSPVFVALSAWLLWSWPARADEVKTAHTPAAVPSANTWTIDAKVSDQMQGEGLPVVGLAEPDWYKYATHPRATSRADRRIQARLSAEHSTGWRIALVGRAQATVAASEDAVSLAATLEAREFPAQDRAFSLRGESQSWRGRGIELGTPWMKTGFDGLEWRTDVQWLQLSDWRTNDLRGVGSYAADGQSYDFDLVASRHNLGIRGPFLGLPGAAGVGASVSVSVQSQWTPNVQVRLRGQDLLSRLNWSRMTSEQLALNTQVQTLRPDGFLDYAPAVTGRQSLGKASGSMGRAWYAEVSWRMNPHDTLQAQVQHVGHMWGSWLVWQRSAPVDQLGWSIGLEPRKQAISLRAAWHGAYLEWAGDSKGKASEIRRLEAGVRVGF